MYGREDGARAPRTRVCTPWGLSVLRPRVPPRGEGGWGMCKMWPETGSELKFTLDSLTPAIGGARLNAAPGQLDVIGRVVYRR